jgi:hypothetical protein
VLDVGLVAAALGLAIFAARDLGGSERQVIRALPLGALFYIIVAACIRTQVFAYPLFVAARWLLASEVRRRRAAVCSSSSRSWCCGHTCADR